jgi:hypothetical protein
VTRLDLRFRGYRQPAWAVGAYPPPAKPAGRGSVWVPKGEGRCKWASKYQWALAWHPPAPRPIISTGGSFPRAQFHRPSTNRVWHDRVPGGSGAQPPQPLAPLTSPAPPWTVPSRWFRRVASGLLKRTSWEPIVLRALGTGYWQIANWDAVALPPPPCAPGDWGCCSYMLCPRGTDWWVYFSAGCGLRSAVCGSLAWLQLDLHLY